MKVNLGFKIGLIVGLIFGILYFIYGYLNASSDAFMMVLLYSLIIFVFITISGTIINYIYRIFKPLTVNQEEEIMRGSEIKEESIKQKLRLNMGFKVGFVLGILFGSLTVYNYTQSHPNYPLTNWVPNFIAIVLIFSIVSMVLWSIIRRFLKTSLGERIKIKSLNLWQEMGLKDILFYTKTILTSAIGAMIPIIIFNLSLGDKLQSIEGLILYLIFLIVFVIFIIPTSMVYNSVLEQRRKIKIMWIIPFIYISIGFILTIVFGLLESGGGGGTLAFMIYAIIFLIGLLIYTLFLHLLTKLNKNLSLKLKIILFIILLIIFILQMLGFLRPGIIE